MNAAVLPATPRPNISFDRVSQVFTSSDGSEVVALDNASFDIGRHEFIAVLGPSGCGKSTLLRILAGLVRPTHGQVSIYGSPVDGPRDELLELVGLKEFGNKRPDELSGGMQQRAAIARALLHDPEILLMDEPFSALDALTRDELSLELLNIWTQRPKTVLFITHSIPEALLLADRILVMSARPGRVQEIIDVDLPRPRSMQTLTEPRFNELANHIRRKVFSRHADH